MPFFLHLGIGDLGREVGLGAVFHVDGGLAEKVLQRFIRGIRQRSGLLDLFIRPGGGFIRDSFPADGEAVETLQFPVSKGLGLLGVQGTGRDERDAGGVQAWQWGLVHGSPGVDEGPCRGGTVQKTAGAVEFVDQAGAVCRQVVGFEGDRLG